MWTKKPKVLRWTAGTYLGLTPKTRAGRVLAGQMVGGGRFVEQLFWPRQKPSRQQKLAEAALEEIYSPDGKAPAGEKLIVICCEVETYLRKHKREVSDSSIKRAIQKLGRAP